MGKAEDKEEEEEDVSSEIEESLTDLDTKNGVSILSMDIK